MSKAIEVTAVQMNRIAADSARRGYNRLLREDFNAEGHEWALVSLLMHEQIAGEPADPHVRCAVYRDGIEDWVALLDVEPSMLARKGA